MRGMGRIFWRGQVLWIAYSYLGKEYRESVRSNRERDAIKLLKKRMGEIGRGRLVGPSEERLTFEELAADYLQEQALKGARSSRWAGERVAHLRAFFGTARALDITTDKIRTFVQTRLQQGRRPAR
jgi:hypothetical protein